MPAIVIAPVRRFKEREVYVIVAFESGAGMNKVGTEIHK
jgi:hypothetical protein